ncbi:MAG: O-antigen ligase family protein [Endomicrobiia bacterium]
MKENINDKITFNKEALEYKILKTTKTLKNFKIGFVLFIIGVIVFFLEVCPPPGRLSFNWWLLFFCVVSFFWGFLCKDYSIAGLILPTANGLSTFLSSYYYPVVSLLILFLVLGFVLSNKFSGNIFYNYNKNKAIILLVFLFFIINIISAFWSFFYLIYPGIVYPVNYKGEDSFNMVVHVVGYFFVPFVVSILLFILNLLFKSEIEIEKFFKFLIIGFIIACIGGIFQHFGVITTNFGYGVPWEKRINSSFSNVNSFALSSSLVVFIFAYYLLVFRKLEYKIVTFIAIGLIVSTNLLLTGSRSALVLMILVAVFSVLYVISNRKVFFSVKLVFFILILIFIFCFLILKINTFGLTRILKTNLKEEIQGRSIFWKVGWRLFKNNILVGNGIKSVYINFYNIIQSGYLSDNACNTYVHFLAEIGVLGLCLFGLIVVFILKSFFYSVKNKNHFEVIISIILVCFLIVSFFGHHLDAEEVSILFWMLLSFVSHDKIFEKNFYITKWIVFGLVSLFFLISSYVNIKKLKNFNVLMYKPYAGIYGKEKFQDKKNVFFTDKYAIFSTKYFKSNKVILEFYNKHIKDQEVTVFLDMQKYSTLKLEPDRWCRLEVALDKPEISTIKIIVKKTYYEAGMLRYIFPFIGKDYRRLGVLVSFYELN